MKLLTILSLNLALLSNLFAVEPRALFEQGNQAYSEENYVQAIALYDSILNSGYVSPEIYFNLGNAYFKTNRLPDAILNYERAKLLNPTDGEITFNLDLAQSLTVDKIDAIPEFFLRKWLRSLVFALNLEVWAMVSISVFVLALFFFGIYLFSGKYRSKRLAFVFSIILLLITAFSFSMASIQNNKRTERNHAIVFDATVTVKSSPDKNGTDLFILHEGTKVEIEDAVGEWREIKLKNGNKGWLRSSAIEVI